MNAGIGAVSGAAFNLVFPIPIICSVEQEDAAAVCVDMNAVIIRPQRTGNEFFCSKRYRF